MLKIINEIKGKLNVYGVKLYSYIIDLDFNCTYPSNILTISTKLIFKQHIKYKQTITGCISSVAATTHI